MAWKPGQTGNPLGRSRSEKPFADALRIAINDADPSDPKGKRKLRRIAEKLVECAMNGEQWAVQMLADRLDGKPLQQTEVSVTRLAAAELGDDELAAVIASERGEGVAEAAGNPPVTH